MFLISKIAELSQDAMVVAWDISLTLINLVTPSRKAGHVTPAGHPGADGKWPEFIEAKEGDSRCSCPALNAMANHGILPRDGRNISFKELNRTVRATYNFAPSFCYFVPNFAAKMLNKNYNKDTFDLAELDLHSDKGIEHDASLLRRDRYFEPNQAVRHMPYIRELLDCATGKDKDGNPLLTIPDLSLISSKRRAQAKAENPEFRLIPFHKVFGSSNSSTLLTIFGGRIRDLETILVDERLPDNWESRIRERQGLTMMTFNRTVLKVEHGTNESKVTVTPPNAGEVAASTQQPV